MRFIIGKKHCSDYRYKIQIDYGSNSIFKFFDNKITANILDARRIFIRDFQNSDAIVIGKMDILKILLNLAKSHCPTVVYETDFSIICFQGFPNTEIKVYNEVHNKQ